MGLVFAKVGICNILMLQESNASVLLISTTVTVVERGGSLNSQLQQGFKMSTDHLI